MNNFALTAVFAAGFAVAFAMAASARADNAPSLQSFGTSKAISAYELSASGMAGGELQPAVAASLGAGNLTLSTSAFGSPPSVSSTALTSNLALDQGRNLDVADRFTSYGQAVSPFLSAVTAPYLALANGGRYSGITFVPAPNLRVRLGASINSERLDHFRFDSGAPVGNLALTYDASQTRSLLGGLSWDVTSALGLDITAISAERAGVPLGFADPAGIAPKAATQALGVSAHMDIGQGWVTTASFNDSLTQLDARSGFNSGLGSNLHEQSYGFSIAKQGLFGDDALGLSFSRPAPSMAGSFAGLTGAGDLAPLVISPTQALNATRTPESDFQLGYVTNFLDGAVALQTNAAYQTNAQGQPGATSVSLLSRAKIKF
jgi:hypothetical protein